MLIPGTSRQVPATKRYERVADVFGAAEDFHASVICGGETQQRWAENLLQPLGDFLIAVHPGAKWVTKRWPTDKFAAVIGRAMGQYQASVVLVGDASEGELGRQLETALRRTQNGARIVNLIGKTSLTQLAAVLRQADILVTNDSGPMHLAAGLGTPVLGIFTCTSPRRSGPPGEAHELVATRVACAASYRKRCPQRGAQWLACHSELDTVRVWKAFERLIEKMRHSRRAA
jgi:ADP-heptose:LPS heptosyltransferase